MPRNGSGSYTPPFNSWNPATDGTPILADDWNSVQADISNAISQSIANDGQTTTTQAIPFAQGARVNNGTAAAPALSFISDPDTGVFRGGNGIIAFACNGAQVFTITPTGITLDGGVTFSGDLSVTGKITATDTVTAPSFVGPLAGNVTGNADTATGWQTARDLSLTGDATATLTGVDGTQNVSAALTLANSGASAGSYGGLGQTVSLSVDAKGRVTSISQTTTPRIVAWAKVTHATNTIVAGFNVASYSAGAVTFTNALPSANYTVNATAGDTGGSGYFLLNVNESSTPSVNGFVLRSAQLTIAPSIASGFPETVYITVIL